MSQRDYSFLDRLTHRIAFLNRAVQLSAADVENTLFSARFRHISLENPVFITSIPRGGTTLLLEILNGHPTFASHCYRDMPFVLAPILWDSMSRSFRQRAVPREREHGDGVMVGYDSPEAFEEVAWKAFWPGRFKADRIPLWGDTDDGAEFEEFLSDQMKKVIALRSRSDPRKTRYVSKNNGNIGRMGFLRRRFPGCKILVPFRDPLAHASSLFRQHSRFSEIHRAESFSKRYMRDLGHFEFGALHRPISFMGIDELLGQFGPESLDYWVGYWVLAFTHVLEYADDVLLVSYENLCRKGPTGLAALGRGVDLEEEESLTAAADFLRSPTEYPGPPDLDRSQLDRAYSIHDRLLSRSIT